ncbi:peptidase C15 pyroglutamyl peptidase I-like protein [Sparassis latifolia]|uniref:Peptidase C15 pyroglutamyl peptidase I-like protein n=1 Tax=Sparassis crispa TaxID=139825 RepID=A0A401GFU4_9APHY|nr:peptidase C15 pyroglutamyl peptidase I-like protein [Sparassis crispa]GBE80973.1 peptidase C15 pyroglutamyl peptidase I-like protein [Sparassis crispa]
MSSSSAPDMAFVDPDALRVLITGFGPFAKYNENPSWLAVKPLNNTIIYTDPPAEPILHVEHDAIITDDMEEMLRPKPVHITTLQVPVTYKAVLSAVPGFHARPPVLPESNDPDTVLAPSPNGYDFILHVGVAGRGPLRLEKISHKNGFRMKDADGEYAPIVPLLPKETPKDPLNPTDTDMDRMADMLGLSSPMTIPGITIPGQPPILGSGMSVPGQARAEGGTDGTDHPPNRGFGKGYETFADELTTSIDVAKLLHYLKENGVEQVYSSMDAGHYLCDFMLYCSLAEAKRLAARQEKLQERTVPPKCTPVLFMHCGPVDQPLSTAEVTEAIKKVVSWVCGRLHT